MTDQLQNYISDPRNAEYNFDLALAYDEQGHLAAAAGFYVRAAVHSSNTLLSYESMLRLGNCLTKLGGRTYMSKGVFLRAISLLPERPEAYYLLSRLYEADKGWQEAYSFAVMGQQQPDGATALRTNVDYPGRYSLVYEQAVTGWWIGLYDESLHLLRQLKKDQTMWPEHVSSVQDNFNRLAGTVHHEPLTYHSSMYERLRVKFPGARDIKRSYSQMCQDIFVLTMLNGKRDGTFLEIGCGDPVEGSNTKLLEEFGWSGTSIDINLQLATKFNCERKSVFVGGDAAKMRFGTILKPHFDYDYLQINTEPPLASLQTLLKIPFDENRFAVITFEHDDYRSDGIKERSRSYLRSHGYVMVVGDISINQYESCEDWWVHPDLVDPRLVDRMLDMRVGTKKADGYMLCGGV